MAGLNRAQRGIVRGLMAQEANGSHLRNQIDDMARMNMDGDWDYEQNVQFCGELSANGYPETAKHLEKKINRQ